MAKLEEMLQTEDSFYSVRSDASTLVVLKVRDAFPSSGWMLIRTNTQKQVQSDHWAFSKLGSKDTVSFPVVTTEELKHVAREGDFLEWQGGFVAPLQSENELLLNEREQELERKIKATREALERKEQTIEGMVRTFLADLEERERKAKLEQELQAKEEQGVFDQKGLALEERIQAFLSDLNERQQRIESEHKGVLTEVRNGGEQIKGEAKYFQVTLQEKREAAITEIEHKISLSQTLAETLQRSFETKEQALNGLVEIKTQEIEGKVKTLQADLAEQKPLSAEKYHQDAARKAFWLSLWLVIAGVVIFALTLLAALLPSTNTALIETFGSVSVILAFLTSGLTFFLRTRNA